MKAVLRHPSLSRLNPSNPTNAHRALSFSTTVSCRPHVPRRRLTAAAPAVFQDPEALSALLADEMLRQDPDAEDAHGRTAMHFSAVAKLANGVGGDHVVVPSSETSN